MGAPLPTGVLPPPGAAPPLGGGGACANNAVNDRVMVRVSNIFLTFFMVYVFCC